VVVSVMGGGKKFSDSEISKTTTVGPLQFDYAILLPKAPIRSNIDIQHLIISPYPNGKHRRPYIDGRANK
jgi:hypothetical protein